MAQTNRTAEADPGREIAEVQARLGRMAREQDVRPLSFDEMLGSPAGANPLKEDIDEFLSLLREWRSEPDSGEAISVPRR